MQTQNQIIFPDCSCCGEHIEKKHRILDGLFQCPKCKNEHYFLNDYKDEILNKLSEADKLRNTHHYDEAYAIYESVTKEHPSLVEAHWGLFLSTYGIVYIEENKNSRYIPAIHQFYDENPTQNRHFLKVIELSKEKHMKNYYLKECEFISKTWVAAKSTIKKIKPVKAKEQAEVNIKQSEPEVYTLYDSKPMGKDLTKGYTIDPIIENKIKSAEQIYLNTKKFSRACKVFDEVLSVDPLAQKAWWDKILCTLEVVSFDELPVQTKLNNMYEMFDQLMGCVSLTDDNIYLQTIEGHLFRKLSEASEFDLSLFEFIMTWKKGGEQHLFSDMLYQEIVKKLDLEHIKSVDFVHQALAAATKHMPKQDSQLTKKYVDIARKVNTLEFYKDSLMLTQFILVQNPNHIQMILIQLCANYKVQEVSRLHSVLKDMKFIKTLEHLLSQKYKALELFEELKLAILSLIEQGNFKLAIQMIESYISLLPVEERNILNQSLLEFSNHLIYHQKFKEANKYVNFLIKQDDKLPDAHWAKFMIALKAHTHFEVLLKNPKKDLMGYPDFERAVNCTRDRKEYIKFYEIQDQLKKPTPQNIMFRRMTRRNFDYFDDMFKLESVETFVNELYPNIEKEAPILFKSSQLSMFNLFNRTVLMILIITFALIMSHMRSLFDPTSSNDSLVVSYNILLLFRDTIGLFLVPGIILLYTFLWVREKENLGKAILGGILSGLIISLAFLLIVGVIPWIIARFMTPLLFGLSPYIVPGVVFGIAVISSFFILRISHLRLVKAKVGSKFVRASIVNMIVLALMILAGIVTTYILVIN